ncbi:DUF724 domain-containing protein 3-like isoform X3 [Macadamia integrifolia]|uniref:DUF724 domain-containing protein 3-like isoform X3 n=1 Tax=Macadamia integrifolia TaxID=60698 RepID=UPI001C502574|nr:DUF724 domain-containing protein 3-like isoform X3 [Macadamia integrifolia]
MKFREGNTVEVLRTKLDPCGSWFPGKIVEVKGDQCTVRYELLLNCEGEPVVEKVHRDDVRPQPPFLRKERWVNGDVAEVFDTHSWRSGKVAKVMNNNRFVVRLFGSIQLREFRKSDLRVQQIWHNMKWVKIGKVGGYKQINYNVAENCSIYSRGLFIYEDPQQGIQEETHSEERIWMDHVKTLSPMKTLKRDRESHFKSSPADAVAASVHRRWQATTKQGKHDHLPVRNLPLIEQMMLLQFLK